MTSFGNSVFNDKAFATKGKLTLMTGLASRISLHFAEKVRPRELRSF